MHRLLIVEDDHATRRFLASTLVNEGYSVMSVENGNKAVIALRRHKVNIVLIDIIIYQ